MKAMILAAGFGTRLLPYTEKIPKPLFPITGRPLLEIMISHLAKAGCDEIIINTHHLHDKIEFFIQNLNSTIPVHVCYEPVILGTGGAIKNMYKYLNDKPFIVVNSDIVTNIDLKKAYVFHLKHKYPATMVLHDYPEYNNVSVSDRNEIIGFGADTKTLKTRQNTNRLAFTGIQVLDPSIIDFIPANSFSSIIDAYRKIIHTGSCVKAYIVKNHYWKDIGTPEHYQKAVFEQLIKTAFKKAFSCKTTGKIVKQKLKGDGSDRSWYRISSEKYTLIMADHGIRSDDSVAEIDAFIHIGHHLHDKGLPVPEIFAYDTFSGLVFLEDLGDFHLQEAVQQAKTDANIFNIYKPVIDTLIKQSVSAKSGFDPLWTYQTACYNEEVIIEKECRYFVDAFLLTYKGLDISFDVLKNEFMFLSDKTLEYSVNGFMHRDMQSRNILIKNNSPYFIDFQGGRIGPIQYDLASLLIDPYTGLPDSLQATLLDYSIGRLLEHVKFDPAAFRTGYQYCSLTRNLQILGAFAYLSGIKKKKYFKEYIPAAILSLKKILEPLQEEFPLLISVIKRL